VAHYLFRATYSQQGLAGLMKEGGSARLKAVRRLVESAGGSFLAAYWAIGKDDFFLIADLPDHAAAVSMATTVGASGAVSSIDTTVLLTAQEVDEARGRTSDYRAPGA
jgi:uncharacterized protein with GYD domain